MSAKSTAAPQTTLAAARRAFFVAAVAFASSAPVEPV
eukprot:CAMPEP_0204194524 /NCGR_PEP_ID=MMETSP0361-20130328/62428_1 /ASSEMBLY_ACC=CAM_ASM_000343 /TAXON_ID=268821 /ORGANISM="Scrippsiella Hangoei, Strain SHTV-5" /LENGTH=36 /DNA_ID= /DNA_START= /DNA_END= /DNA_ORIENTATION=